MNEQPILCDLRKSTNGSKVLRRLSAAGKAGIAAATKKRWALKRAEAAKGEREDLKQQRHERRMNSDDEESHSKNGGLRPEGHGLAILVGRVADDVFVQHHVVGGFHQRVEALVDLALAAGGHFVGMA